MCIRWKDPPLPAPACSASQNCPCSKRMMQKQSSSFDTGWSLPKMLLNMSACDLGPTWNIASVSFGRSIRNATGTLDAELPTSSNWYMPPLCPGLSAVGLLSRPHVAAFGVGAAVDRSGSTCVVALPKDCGDAETPGLLGAARRDAGERAACPPGLHRRGDCGKAPAKAAAGKVRALADVLTISPSMPKPETIVGRACLFVGERLPAEDFVEAFGLEPVMRRGCVCNAANCCTTESLRRT
mmetsp:Transcript_76992/g.200496  ORF Transcript_76992/g.200496 Transcript_76992/m.200496 type:complete len:240 (+) Transcript_76992:524-1243(+)